MRVVYQLNKSLNIPDALVTIERSVKESVVSNFNTNNYASAWWRNSLHPGKRLPGWCS
ncbi:MAG: hypothetical protein JSS83_22335 [Cyanobacteria bacterium SZAS LIN-3]|nr:hypothetical protein [Cyanobacteria bacterium SZAS LIN-3]MBS2009477.1 hypothetical protein [Cyanobacteria bacterium SZAS TMP-1]